MGRKLLLYAIIDTATELVAVEGKPCFNCEYPTYDIEPSVQAGTAYLSNSVESVQYGQTIFRGSWARDKICVSLASCVDLDFFYITNQNGMPDKIDAILGFARPKHDIRLAPERTPRQYDYYLQAISESSEEAMFSTRYR